MTTSHCFGCFWVHIKWKGGVGIDQHGRRWANPSNPQPEQIWVVPMMETLTDAISLAFKVIKYKKIV